ncbi:hypothetical protein [Rubrivirga sp.]|uniref:hypothetical protein n=1 Tax=Rubrivirga sp. TaxID=1885344 RepID=UPI003C75C9F6
MTLRSVVALLGLVAASACADKPAPERPGAVTATSRTATPNRPAGQSLVPDPSDDESLGTSRPARADLDSRSGGGLASRSESSASRSEPTTRPGSDPPPSSRPSAPRPYGFVFDDFSYGPTDFDLGRFFDDRARADNQIVGGSPETLFGRSTWHVLEGDDLESAQARFWYYGSISEDPYKAHESVNRTFFDPKWPERGNRIRTRFESLTGPSAGDATGRLRLGFEAGHSVEDETTFGAVTLASGLMANTGTWLVRVKPPRDYHRARGQLLFQPWLYNQVQAINEHQPWQWICGTCDGRPQLVTWNEVNTESLWYGGEGQYHFSAGTSISPGFLEHVAGGNARWQGSSAHANPELVALDADDRVNAARVETCRPPAARCNGATIEGDVDEIAEYLLSGDRYVSILFSIAEDGRLEVVWHADRSGNVADEAGQFASARLESYDTRFTAELAEMWTILWVGTTQGRTLERDWLPEFDYFYYATDPSLGLEAATADALEIRRTLLAETNGRHLRATNDLGLLDNGLRHDGDRFTADPPDFTLGVRYGRSGTIKTYDPDMGIVATPSETWAFAFPRWVGTPFRVNIVPTFRLSVLEGGRWTEVERRTRSGMNYAFDQSRYPRAERFRIEAEFVYVDDGWSEAAPLGRERESIVIDNPFFDPNG